MQECSFGEEMSLTNIICGISHSYWPCTLMQCIHLHTEKHIYPLLANSDRKFERVYASFFMQEDLNLCLISYFVSSVLHMNSHHPRGEGIKTFAVENKGNLNQDFVRLCRKRADPASMTEKIQFCILSSCSYLDVSEFQWS